MLEELISASIDTGGSGVIFIILGVLAIVALLIFIIKR